LAQVAVFVFEGPPCCVCTPRAMHLPPVAVAVAATAALLCRADGRSFVIKNDSFVKDGQPFVLRSGSLHYPRVPRAYWRDRMQRMKALGLNCVTMYTFWNVHEEVEGSVSFTSEGDVTAFLDTAQGEGLLVLLRPGPYICGEWEFGGLPAWLLAKPGIQLRTYHDEYIAAVDKWWNALLPQLSRYLYSRGGPIVAVQIENEYGSFGNCAQNPADAKYMEHLLDLATSHFGTDVVYTTIDGGEGPSAARLAHGNPWRGDPRVLATVDGALAEDYEEAFQRQRSFNAIGHSPKMWSELWTGWFTAWGQEVSNKSAAEFRTGVGAMVESGASFSLYMAHGGTNFGFWSGANSDKTGLAFTPDITSYDYSAPISEAGVHNIGSDGEDLFVAIQDVISKRYGMPPKEPAPIPMASYGQVQLVEAALLFDHLDTLKTCDSTVLEGKPLPSMEALGQNYGLILYRYAGGGEYFEPKTLEFPASYLHDRAQVFVDGVEVGTAYRSDCPLNMSVPRGSSMDMLLENMGRINYGQGMYDHKGFIGLPPMPGKWTALCLPLQLEQLNKLPFGTTSKAAGPTFRRGVMQIPDAPRDTFLDTGGLTKGYVWVNGKLLGRYWDTKGPQHTLYAPAPFLKKGDNDVLVLDLHHGAGSAGHISSVTAPRYAEPTASQSSELVI